MNVNLLTRCFLFCSFCLFVLKVLFVCLFLNLTNFFLFGICFTYNVEYFVVTPVAFVVVVVVVVCLF